MKKQTAFSADDLEKVLQYTEHLLRAYGAAPAALHSEDRFAPHGRRIFLRQNEYYRVDVIHSGGVPRIVFEWTDNPHDAAAGILADADSFPADLPAPQIEKEVRYLFGIEPYPKDR